jgi:hypothetical protein
MSPVKDGERMEEESDWAAEVEGAGGEEKSEDEESEDENEKSEDEECIECEGRRPVCCDHTCWSGQGVHCTGCFPVCDRGEHCLDKLKCSGDCYNCDDCDEERNKWERKKEEEENERKKRKKEKKEKKEK